MTNSEKRKAEKYLDGLYLKAIKTSSKSAEDTYLGVRHLIGSMDLIWYRDKQGKHHIY